MLQNSLPFNKQAGSHNVFRSNTIKRLKKPQHVTQIHLQLIFGKRGIRFIVQIRFDWNVAINKIRLKSEFHDPLFPVVSPNKE